MTLHVLVFAVSISSAVLFLGVKAQPTHSTAVSNERMDGFEEQTTTFTTIGISKMVPGYFPSSVAAVTAADQDHGQELDTLQT